MQNEPKNKKENSELLRHEDSLRLSRLEIDLENLYISQRWDCPHCGTPGAIFDGRGKFEMCPVCPREDVPS